MNIGKYKVIRAIGAGGMGIVYEARDEELNRSVAIKLLQDRFNNQQMRGRFRTEAQAAATLQHPNIVVIYETGEDNGRPFIAMEYLTGSTLEALAKSGAPLSQTARLHIIEALCDGLGEAHSREIIHRDIKPANLLLTDKKVLKIVDFGIARTADSTTGPLMGTLHYMAPERLTKQTVDHRSDIFSVGAVLYEFLSGRRAFQGERDEAAARILAGNPEPLGPSCDPDIERIVFRALSKRPEDRYQRLSEMRRDISRTRKRLERELPPLLDSTLISDEHDLVRLTIQAATMQFDGGNHAEAIQQLELLASQNDQAAEALALLRDRLGELQRKEQRIANVNRLLGLGEAALDDADFEAALRYANEALLADETSISARELGRRIRNEQRRSAQRAKAIADSAVALTSLGHRAAEEKLEHLAQHDSSIAAVVGVLRSSAIVAAAAERSATEELRKHTQQRAELDRTIQLVEQALEEGQLDEAMGHVRQAAHIDGSSVWVQAISRRIRSVEDERKRSGLYVDALSAGRALTTAQRCNAVVSALESIKPRGDVEEALLGVLSSATHALESARSQAESEALKFSETVQVSLARGYEALANGDIEKAIDQANESLRLGDTSGLASSLRQRALKLEVQREQLAEYTSTAITRFLAGDRIGAIALLESVRSKDSSITSVLKAFRSADESIASPKVESSSNDHEGRLDFDLIAILSAARRRARRLLPRRFLTTEADVLEALGLPVLASIPEHQTDAERRFRSRRRTLRRVMVGAALTSLSGVIYSWLQ